MLKLVYTILLIVIIGSITIAQPINQTGFEPFIDKQEFTQQSWQSEGFTVPWVDGFNQKRAYIDNAYTHSGTKSLRITYPARGVGPKETGAQAPLKVTPVDELYMSYWVRFSNNFSWGTYKEGGKLPGLGGGENCSGCIPCTGSNGFTARLMWRTDGKGVLYLYHLNKISTCGDDITLKTPEGEDFHFKKGVWYKITERVKANTGKNHDGEVQVWINDQPALYMKGLQFVDNGDKVDNLYFSTFHGGNTSDWGPTEDCYIWFDDIIISTNRSDVLPADALDTPQKTRLYTEEITIFPSVVHAGKKVTISIDDTLALPLSFELMNASKDIIQKFPVKEHIQTIQIPYLSKGTYSILIRFKDFTIVRKIEVP